MTAIAICVLLFFVGYIFGIFTSYITVNWMITRCSWIYCLCCFNPILTPTSAVATTVQPCSVTIVTDNNV